MILLPVKPDGQNLVMNVNKDKFMRKIRYIFCALAIFNIASGQTGDDLKKKISPALLEQTNNGQSSPFLIVLSKQADLTPATRLSTKDEKSHYVYNALQQIAENTQAKLVAFLNQQNIPHESVFIINAIKAEGTHELIYSIAQRTDVSQILDIPNMKISEPIVLPKVNDVSRNTIEWGIEMINANDVWALGIRGQGVTVGGEDTGYDWMHPALIKQYRGYNPFIDSVDHNYNWHDAIHSISPLNADSINPCGLDVPEPCDDNGHGTHTMGTMIGLDGENEIGVAPEARWCGCRNMERGWGSPFTYIECFQWFLAPTDLNNENPDPSKAPHVINNSWSCPAVEGCDSSNWEVMNQVVNILRLAGIVVVVSAGNDGNACSTISNPPGMLEGSFSVGATAMNDTIAFFSSRGPVSADSSFRLKPDISAPGVGIRSSRPGGFYGRSSGTSMAGPHVAGVVALMISANPDLAGKVEIIEDIIKQTAVAKTTDQDCGGIPGTEVPNHTYGYGRIDALAAVEAAIALIPVSTEHEIKGNEIKVYPNPFFDQLIIEIKESVGKVNVELVDTNGRILLRYDWNTDSHSSIKVDLHNQPGGIYFYRILTANTVDLGKVIKN